MPEALWLLLLLLLPVAAASGWYVRGQRPGTGDSVAPGRSDYWRGLHYLVNDESDRAIESFVRVLEVNDDTVDMHLALGNLFRRQGEVDRALRIHENLVARPNLDVGHRNQARYELARDYLRAGVLDRAEHLFRELVDNRVFVERAMSGLITIYEQERDWPRAIEVTRQLESARGYSLRPVIAQYYCELAEQARDDDEFDNMRHCLKQARSAYRGCVRASLLRGALAERDGEPRLAIRIYRHVLRQDEEFVSETLEPLRRCHARLDDLRNYGLYLRELMDMVDAVQPHIAYAQLLHDEGRTDEGIAHLSQYLQRQANWIGFHQLLELTSNGAQTGLTGPLDSLRQALARILERQAVYLCSHCGFSGRYLHWQCPRCRQWNSMAPVADIQPAP